VNVLDIFAGLGGFSLGLERAGMQTVAFAEIEPYCRRVLAHHWPNVPCYHDVRHLNISNFKRVTGHEASSIDLICGGFPCQGISVAGKGLGLEDERSALWFEYARIIWEFRPSWVIIENVPALRSRGLDQVLGSLTKIGYDAEWNCIPSSCIGAPHRRDRIWIVAYPNERERERRATQPVRRRSRVEKKSQSIGANPDPAGLRWGTGRKGRLTNGLAWLRDYPRWNPADTYSAELPQREGQRGNAREEFPTVERGFNPDVWQHRWPDEPALSVLDDGSTTGLDVATFAIGNSLVPQIAEAIGRAILTADPTVTILPQRGFF
jgi:DNA (cytosine-5)-methyltransferase 1